MALEEDLEVIIPFTAAEHFFVALQVPVEVSVVEQPDVGETDDTETETDTGTETDTTAPKVENPDTDYGKSGGSKRWLVLIALAALTRLRARI